MGYLDNTSVVVDVILTKKGRELLSRQDGSFRVTQFALADDEIDYTLYNESHPNGTAFYGEAIEALPLIEAIPNENNTMISKLVTLNRGTTKIPVLQVQSDTIGVNRNSTFNINPETLNHDSLQESAYSFTIADRRLIQQGSAGGAGSASGGSTGTINLPFVGTALSETFIGTSFSGLTLAGTTLFGSNAALATSIIVVGLDTVARTTITLTVNKEGTGGNTAASQTKSSY